MGAVPRHPERLQVRRGVPRPPHPRLYAGLQAAALKAIDKKRNQGLPILGVRPLVSSSCLHFLRVNLGFSLPKTDGQYCRTVDGFSAKIHIGLRDLTLTSKPNYERVI